MNSHQTPPDFLLWIILNPSERQLAAFQNHIQLCCEKGSPTQAEKPNIAPIGMSLAENNNFAPTIPGRSDDVLIQPANILLLWHESKTNQISRLFVQLES